ncbi:polysaccharide deacetylase family protein [Microaerobacter geothermalis]|nr:polysaccharide deacetylase family protein [Microaerobacter geothermalis]
MKQITILLLILTLLFAGGCNQQAQPNEKKENNQENIQSSNDKTQIQGEESTKPLSNEKNKTPDLAGGKESEVREPHPLTLSDLRTKYPNIFVLSGPSHVRRVALTFDDGPDLQFTPQILDVLKKHNVKATFFIVGNRAKAHPEIVKRIVREGHAIGNHTWNHANLPKLPIESVRNQIIQTDNTLKNIIGYKPKLFRAPYGAMTEETVQMLGKMGYTAVGWTVDSLDWKGLSKEAVSDNVLSNIFPGAIILQHSAGGKGEDLSGTVKALSEIIHKLKNDRVEFYTVPDLLGIPWKRP